MAERDLARLVAGMAPVVVGRDWGFAVSAGGVPAGVQSFATVAEAKGLTLIAPMAQLRAAGLGAEGPMARISLGVTSSLEAVGLTAAIATALAGAGISANVVAGFHHDHIFLPAAEADRAMAVLAGLSRG